MQTTQNSSRLLRSYNNKNYNLFDCKVEKFVSSEILKKNIIDEYNQAVSEVWLDDPIRNVRLLKIQKTATSTV